MLTNELLHRAKESEVAWLFLKLDIVNAFNKVDWHSFLALLRKLKFGRQFYQFIKAILSIANSAIVINDMITKSFTISQSMRQGCPLLPLLFLIVLEALSKLLQRAMELG